MTALHTQGILGKIIAVSCLFFIIAGAIFPATVSAVEGFGDAKNYILLAPIPGTYLEGDCARGTANTYTNAGASTGNNSKVTNCKTDFITYLKGAFRLVISLSSIIAVLVITFEGFKLAVSTSEGARATAKDRIQQALIGLGLVLGSYLILNTINPQLTKINFAVDKVADYAGSSAFLQNGLGQALVNEREQAAFAARSEASRIANESFSKIATPLLTELNQRLSTGEEECRNARAEIQQECYVNNGLRIEELQKQIEEARNSTGMQSAINEIQRLGDTQFNQLVGPLLNTGDRLADVAQMRNNAKLQITAVKDETQVRVAVLRAQGRTEDAALVLAESNKVIAAMNEKIEHRVRCPYSDVVVASAGVGGASVRPCI
ncbi:MAG: pilin [bacterium]